MTTRAQIVAVDNVLQLPNGILLCRVALHVRRRKFVTLASGPIAKIMQNARPGCRIILLHEEWSRPAPDAPHWATVTWVEFPEVGRWYPLHRASVISTVIVARIGGMQCGF